MRTSGMEPHWTPKQMQLLGTYRKPIPPPPWLWLWAWRIAQIQISKWPLLFSSSFCPFFVSYVPLFEHDKHRPGRKNIFTKLLSLEVGSEYQIQTYVLILVVTIESPRKITSVSSLSLMMTWKVDTNTTRGKGFVDFITHLSWFPRSISMDERIVFWFDPISTSRYRKIPNSEDCF